MKLSEAYIKELGERMEKGASEYQDKSWSRDPVELIGEIEEELADVAGWAGILWCRLRKMKEALIEIRANERSDLPKPG